MRLGDEPRTSLRRRREGVVSDFVELLGMRDRAALIPFLDDDVFFAHGTGCGASGRESVLDVCEAIWAAFDVYQPRVMRIAASGPVILVQELLTLRLPGISHTHEIAGFASFEIRNMRIVAWTQVNG